METPPGRRILHPVTDEDLLARIKALVDEEHSLSTDDESPSERATRRREIEIQLDRCWDLLRRRQARREFGGNASTVEASPDSQVEDYLQ